MTHSGGEFYLILNVHNKSSYVLAEVQGRQIHIQSKCLFQTWWKWFNIINLPPVSWLIYPGNGAILWTWSWYLLLENKILHNGCSYSLWQVEIYVAKPMHNLHPMYHGHFVLKPIRRWQESGERVTGTHKTGYPLHPTCCITLSFTEFIHCWEFTWDTNISNVLGFFFFALPVKAKISLRFLFLSKKKMAYTIPGTR